MTTQDALGLRYGDRVRVKMVGRRRWQLAVVTDTPRSHHSEYSGRDYALVPFAYVLRDTGVGTETLRSGDHLAMVPTDEMERER